MKQREKVRYAVVGLGYIAQQAVLPAFKHAKNSELVALISSDEKKRRELSRKYGVEHTANYDDYEKCLREADVDAVYIALPNDMHCEYTIRAARVGVHVLCEKPMALTSSECERMKDACELAGVKLMVAYRLHFDVAHLDAIDIARDSDFGSMRFFTSAFTRQIRDRDNIRLKKERGGGPLYDLGVYAINAARYLFRAEPLEVSAFMESSEDVRFQEVEEMVTAVLRFPENKLASFTASFGAAESSWYELYGAKSLIRMEPAYEYAEPLSLILKVGGEKPKTFGFQREDQFAPLVIHLSDCVLNSRDVGPSAVEGMADVKIIEAIRESAFTGRAVSLQNIQASVNRPSSSQGMTIPPVKKPGLVHAAEPSRPIDPGQLKGDSKKTA